MNSKHVWFSVEKMASAGMFKQILSHFPKKNMQLAFAYGSGVFQQTGHKDMSKNMLDFVFAVDNPMAWHKENLERNPSHYSFCMKFRGPRHVAKVQDHSGARVFFNTLVPCEDRIIKYGVISTQSLINDLLDWETLYMSGRLHKPVLTLQQGDNTQLTPALVTNLQSAVHLSLLLLPETFSELELFTTITGLSYSGDFRMTIGEDKNKVMNIVQPNLSKFKELYLPILRSEDHLHWNEAGAQFTQDLSPSCHLHHLNLLPKMVMSGLVKHLNADGRHRDTEEVLRSLADDSECGDVIRKCVSDIVKQSSLSQSWKGIRTAGIFKSLRYSWAKLKKMWKSKK